MICFNCGYQHNAYNAEQCRVCGTKFPVLCDACQTPNPKLAQFCMNCGNNLKNIKNNLPEDKLIENRKNVAVVFADISNFTSLSEKLDPEEVRDLVNDCFQYITKPVYELGGTIDKYIGDCIMILFGAKKTHSDDAFRAVSCAIQMNKRIEDFSNERFSKTGMKMQLSIGINYGLVVTGEVGTHKDKNYTVMGDVVNTANRLQTASRSGGILVSQSVYEESNELVHYSQKVEIQAKNKENTVSCYTPIGLRAQTILENRNLVSRDKHLEIINNKYNAKTNVNHISVVGESGLGKTTLVKNFLSNYGKDIREIWINSNVINKDRPYNVISGVIASILNINPNDTYRIKRNRLMSFSDYILKDYSEADIIRNYNFIALIMGLERDSDYKNIINSMEYSDLEREIFRQVSIFFENLDNRQNLVIIIDDMQFADKESAEILKNLNKFGGFFIFISQYPVFNDESEKDNLLKLDRFNESETGELISLKLEESNIDTAFIRSIYSITNGNPMFICEIMQTIIRKKFSYKKDNFVFIKEEVIDELPKTLESTILKNIGELDETSLNFLKVASVVGNEFSLSWIFELMGVETDEIDVLKLPIKLNIIEFMTIQKSLDDNEKIYVFTQNATRMVIYNSMLNADKREYHEKTAKLIERLYKKEMENYYEILGFHYINANLPSFAKTYFLKTAQKLKGNYVYDSALEYYSKFINIESKEKKLSNESDIVSAYMDRGEILINTARYSDALIELDKAEKNSVQGESLNNISLMKAKILKETARFDEALEILDEVESRLSKSSNLFGKALQLRCAIYIVLGKENIIELVKKSEDVLLKSRDYESLSETMSHAGIKHFFTGNPAEAISYFEKALGYAKKSNKQDVMSKIYNNLGIIYHATGEIDKSFVYLNTALEVFKNISNIKSYLSTEINLGIFYMEKGLYGKALKLFNDAIEKSNEVELFYQTCLALSNKADVEYEMGNYKSAENLYKQSMEIAVKFNMTVEIGLNCVGIAKANLNSDLNEGVIENLLKAKEIFEKAEELPSIGDYNYYMAIYNLKLKECSKALDFIEKAIEIAKKVNDDTKLIKSIRRKGDILMCHNEFSKAFDQYNRSLELADEIGSSYELAKSYFSRYKLYVNKGEISAAKADLSKAKKFVMQIDFCKWTNEIIEEKI